MGDEAFGGEGLCFFTLLEVELGRGFVEETFVLEGEGWRVAGGVEALQSARKI